MNPATEDLHHRRPVWEALSDLFLNMDTSLGRSWRVGIPAASPYSLDELQQILVREVYPVCRFHPFGTERGRAGFDPQWLEGSILHRLRSQLRRFQAHCVSRLTVPLSSEWRHTKDGILQRRSQDHAANAA